MCDAATPRLRAEMTRVINEAVSEAMSDYDEKLINITYGSSGKILSVETDSVKINLLRALVTEKINEKIKSYSEYTVTISFSNIMDDEIVFGRFPSWRIPASVERQCRNHRKKLAYLCRNKSEPAQNNAFGKGQNNRNAAYFHRRR